MTGPSDWDPLKELLTVQKRMNKLFESALERTDFDALVATAARHEVGLLLLFLVVEHLRARNGVLEEELEPSLLLDVGFVEGQLVEGGPIQRVQ